MQTLRDLIFAEHSKAQANFIVDIICQKPILLDDLIEFVLADEELLSRRASWPLRLLHKLAPELFSNHITILIEQLENIKSKSIIRNVLAILKDADLPEDKKAYLLNYCSRSILDPNSPIALIAQASDLFAKIADNEYFLMEELLLMLKQVDCNNRGAIISKIRQVKVIIRKQKKLT